MGKYLSLEISRPITNQGRGLSRSPYFLHKVFSTQHMWSQGVRNISKNSLIFNLPDPGASASSRLVRLRRSEYDEEQYLVGHSSDIS